MADTIVRLQQECEQTLEAIRNELAHIRTGRATPQLLDGIRVDYYGSSVPLHQVATIHVPEPRLLTIQPWEKNLMGEITRAIQKSELGLNPAADGQLLRLPIPPLTEERRRDLMKVVKKIGEEGKVSLRNHRREANEALKRAEKAKTLTEDEHHKQSERVQKITDEFIKKIDELVARKDAEVMEV
jgi:ribosome recycling factor